MTAEELEHKARVNSLVYDTKYAEDGVLEEMLSRPQDFVDGAIMEIVQLLREKANRDGFIAGAKELQEETLREIIEIEKVSDYRWEENQQLKQQNEQLEKQIKDLESQLKDVIEYNDYYQKENEKMKQYCACEFCRHCDNELTNPETGETICDICNNGNLWELRV